VSSDFDHTFGLALCGKPRCPAVVYTRRSDPQIKTLARPPDRETHLSAERAPPEAAPRVSSANVVAWRARDPEATPRERAQAALGLKARQVQRRHRLSRSRDFDDVYRRGTSASTRYLVLHWFPREDDADGEPRLGLAVPRSVGSAVMRNRMKRQLREAWRRVLADVPVGHDYVLVARPGLAEPAQARGQDWLVSELTDALGRMRQ
jgi:ribonuclease P protein component